MRGECYLEAAGDGGRLYRCRGDQVRVEADHLVPGPRVHLTNERKALFMRGKENGEHYLTRSLASL